MESESEILVIIVVFSNDLWPSEVAIIGLIVNKKLSSESEQTKRKENLPNSGKEKLVSHIYSDA